MDFIQSIIDGNGFPVLTAFLLGLVVALHPCPLATNIAAMGYLAKDAHVKRRVFVMGLSYTLGRILAYSVLGAVLIAVFAVAYVLFTGSMVRNYKYMLEWHFLWQEAMDVELLSVAALLVICVPLLLKMRPERQNNIA